MGEFETFPSFNFFARDWLAGTLELTAEQRGMFIHMLASSWEQTPPCTLADVDVILAQAAGVSVQRWRKVGAPVRRKFNVIDGRLRNEKLWAVYQDACANRDRRRRAGKKGGQAIRDRYTKQKQSPSNALAMPRTEGRAKTELPIPMPLDPSIEGSSVTEASKRTDALVTDITSRMGRRPNAS